MTDLSRGTRARRAGRRPGWVLLTVLLVLAIGASSALVFTNRVELLKLAVILALWAAVVAAFVSVIYRRQSDIDQAKVRDLKLVYDLQLDREISARREYELTVESQLRRELTSEIRAQAADEVAGLRAELAALRANLEILFDADLSHRPALETDRSRAYGEWPRGAESAGRVTASRIDTEDREDLDANTEESPIIDVPAEPHPPEPEWATPNYGGAHRRPSETEQERRRRHRAEEQSRAWSPPQPAPPSPPQPPPQPVSQPTPEPQFTWQPPQQERPPTPQPKPPPPPASAAARARARASTGRADADRGLAARSRRGTVATPRRTRQQLGVAGAADERQRVGRRIRRQKTRPRAHPGPIACSAGPCSAGYAVPACRTPAGPPFSSGGRCRSRPPARAADVDRRVRRSPATPRARPRTAA